MNTTHFNDSSPVKKQGTPTALDFKNAMRTRIHQDVEVLYREFCKCQEVELNKSNLPYSKLMHHNPDKWKMKFKGLFEREKIISFDSGRTSTVDLKRFKQTTF